MIRFGCVKQLLIRAHGLSRRRIHDAAATVEQQRPFAQLDDAGRRVRDKEDRRAAAFQFFEPRKAFALEFLVAHRERFVDDKNVRVDHRLHRECELDHHAARIRFDRLIEKVADICERNDIVEARFHFLGD